MTPKGEDSSAPDPVGYPLCVDLYAYTTGDPINYIDLDGRFASHAYKVIHPPVIGMSNAFSTLCAHQGIGNSGTFQVGSFDLQNGAIGFINGINNTRSHSIESAYQLSQYAQGAKIDGVYNATNLSGPLAPLLGGAAHKLLSIGADIIECGLGRIGIHTPPVQMLKNRWSDFINSHGSKDKFFQPCHSGGAVHVKNALQDSSESTRQRIIVLAIAPSVIIPKKLCFQSYNYVSRRDFVTHLDVVGKLKYGNELHILEPHPNAKFLDHEFASPTFAPVIKRRIADYLKTYGGNK